MSARGLGRCAAVSVLSWALFTPAVAQDRRGDTGSANQTGQSPQSAQTGVGPRGTQVGPTAKPGQESRPATGQRAEESRGQQQH